MSFPWETRRLTKSNEDDLTDALVDALNTDAPFRAAYEQVVLTHLRPGESTHIVKAEPRRRFPGHHSTPDMMLLLADGREVACEHKIMAGQTKAETAEGGVSLQLERYLELPGVEAVAYFRPTWRAPEDAILFDPRYLHPPDLPHFLWRHLYPALCAGSRPSTVWLRRGFEDNLFTPAVPHVGPLVGQGDMENFGKLWDATVIQLFKGWQAAHGTLSVLYLTPRAPSPFQYVMLVPKAKNGTELRTRMPLLDEDQSDATLELVRERLAVVLPTLPVKSTMTSGYESGRRVVDLHTPLSRLLDEVREVAAQEARLLAHVLPVAESLCFE